MIITIDRVTFARMDADRVKQILDKIFEGAWLKDALEKNEREPFYKYLDEFPESARLYDRAQQVRAELVVDEIIEIADDHTADPQHNRNRIDARKWVASKMRPTKYGDRIDVNVTATVDLTAALMAAERRLLPIKDVLAETNPATALESRANEKEAITPIGDGPISGNIPISIGSSTSEAHSAAIGSNAASGPDS